MRHVRDVNEICYMNGFTILSLPSITLPWCMSSVYRVEQPAFSAAATITESRKENWYLAFNIIAVLKALESIGTNLVDSQRTSVFSSHTAAGSFIFRKQALYVSITTCELINGLCFKSKRALSCLAGSDLSNQYTQMLESRKISLIQIFALPLFNFAKVNRIIAVKFYHLLVRTTGCYRRFIYGKSNYFGLRLQESLWQMYYQIGSCLRMDDCSVYFHKQALIA
jgi:hypothetical protein